MAKRSDSYKHILSEGDHNNVVNGELITVLKFLESLKDNLENVRRFETSPQRQINAVGGAEGDIEEFLIEHGYWVSEE